jgi:L-seryl-tRNA(Ser) seleniumtransferase
VRPDKLTLAALHATLADWKTGRWRELPLYRAAGAPLAELERRGQALLDSLGGDPEFRAEVVPALALFGGGTSPEKQFASRALALTHAAWSADEIAARLRASRPVVVSRVEEGRVLLDLRSIAPEEDETVLRALRRLAEDGRDRPSSSSSSPRGPGRDTA